MQERHDNDKIEPHNHNEYPLLYKEAELLTSVLGRFLECRKWNILVITWALGIFLIYMLGPTALGLGHIYQANPSCPWYNYYIFYAYNSYDLTGKAQDQQSCMFFSCAL